MWLELTDVIGLGESWRDSHCSQDASVPMGTSAEQRERSAGVRCSLASLVLGLCLPNNHQMCRLHLCAERISGSPTVPTAGAGPGKASEGIRGHWGLNSSSDKGRCVGMESHDIFSASGLLAVFSSTLSPLPSVFLF